MVKKSAIILLFLSVSVLAQWGSGPWGGGYWGHDSIGPTHDVYQTDTVKTCARDAYYCMVWNGADTIYTNTVYLIPACASSGVVSAYRNAAYKQWPYKNDAYKQGAYK